MMLQNRVDSLRVQHILIGVSVYANIVDTECKLSYGSIYCAERL